MLSYPWSKQKLAHKLYSRLQDAGVPLWMDIHGGIRGGGHDITTAMAEGVANAAVFLPMVCKEYQQSLNCKKECNYAKDCHIPMVPIMAEDPECWPPRER